MRILFIENRSATLLWHQAALGLENQGCSVSWIVQNHHFAPDSHRVFKIPYPKQYDLSEEPLDEELQRIARTDRALIHFGVRPTHYHFYRKQIHELIDKIAPDVVFGEATQYHELLALEYCKSLGIPYLAPNATRYPPSRLVFFLYDSFQPVGGSSLHLDESDANLMLENIINRRVIPSYMEPPHISWISKLTRVREKLRVAIGWVRGERYITPSPWRRLALDRAQQEARICWDTLASERGGMMRLPRDGRWVLYPLQLQPESNLDVFGQPWINQCATIERAARALGACGAKLVVKPNPKSKYEMNAELVNMAKALDNIIVLPHDCPMGAVFQAAPLVLSVTGTVIIESIFQSKPVAVLGSHCMTQLPGVTPIDCPEAVAELLIQVEQGTVRRATRDEAYSVLGALFGTSYDALLWDPISRPDLFRVDLIEKLQAAFVDVVSHLPPAKRFGGSCFDAGSICDIPDSATAIPMRSVI